MLFIIILLISWNGTNAPFSTDRNVCVTDAGKDCPP